VLLIGLASKNAILIVEFAKDKHELEGYSIVEAAGAAAGERLRALLMTALTTLLGTLPMMIASGAGAASRRHLGTTEFWGMFFCQAAVRLHRGDGRPPPRAQGPRPPVVPRRPPSYQHFSAMGSDPMGEKC